MYYTYEQKITIPQDLLDLFNYHYDEIISNPLNFDELVLNEPSEEYILDSIKEKNISEKTFSELLLNYIDLSNLTDIEVYKRAFVDKRIFSKIRSNKNYHPSFGTITLFALALELTTSEFQDLLHSASYSLPQNSYINITLKYCFDNSIYNICTVNELVYGVAGKEIKNL